MTKSTEPNGVAQRTSLILDMISAAGSSGVASREIVAALGITANQAKFSCKALQHKEIVELHRWSDGPRWHLAQTPPAVARTTRRKAVRQAGQPADSEADIDAELDEWARKPACLGRVDAATAPPPEICGPRSVFDLARWLT